MANVSAYETYINATASTAFEAWEAILEAVTKAGGDWEVTGPFGCGILSGAIETGKGYVAHRK